MGPDPHRASHPEGGVEAFVVGVLPGIDVVGVDAIVL